MKSLFLFVLILSISIQFSGCMTFPPLHTAVSKGDIKKVTKLLNEGADVDIVFFTSTPLISAAYLGHIDIARLLIERGANVNAKCPECDIPGTTPLLTALSKGHDDVARLLIEKGANLNAIDSSGSTALGWAAVRGNTNMINLLIDRGADIDIAIVGLERVAAKIPVFIPGLALLKKIKNEKEKGSHGKD